MNDIDIIRKIHEDYTKEIMTLKEYERTRQHDAQMVQVAQEVLRTLRAKGQMLPSMTEPNSGYNVGVIASKYIKMGKDFDKLMTTVKEDFTLSGEWERFMMMLKLAE